MRPGVGEQAAGYGVSGAIVAVPELQPLGPDGVWRVTLAGEVFGRLVRLGEGTSGRVWQLLQFDDVTDEQFEAYEAGMRDAVEQIGSMPAAKA